MTKFIAQDEYGIAIMSIGDTEEEALAIAIENAGPLFDADGNDLTNEQAAEKFCVYPATDALIAKVEAEGGAIVWDIVDGVACTIEEEGADD